MRRVSAAAVAAVAAVAAAGPPPAGAAGRGCAPPGAKLLAHNRYLRVFEPARAVVSGPSAIEACLAGHTGHMTLLAADRPGPVHRSLGRFELAGRVLAFLVTQFGVDSGTTTLVVADIGARRVLRSQEAGSYSDAGILFRRGVVKFLPTAHGSLAWTVEETHHQQLAGVDVYAAGRTGAPRLLESGTDIDPGSLALSGSTLSWSRAGTARTAPMP